MTAEYRVLDYNGTFYPQEKKRWRGWCDMKSDCYWDYTMTFPSMQESVDFIKSRIERSQIPVVVWQTGK